MKKKKIIVIGGSSGIGKAVAEMAAEWGNQVILTRISSVNAEIIHLDGVSRLI